LCFDDCSFTFCGDGIIQSPNGYNVNEACEADADCLPGDACVGCTCTPAFVGLPFLKITQYTAEPRSFNAPSAASPNSFSDIVVRVLNSGTAAEAVSIELRVLDPLTNLPLDPDVSDTANCGLVGAGRQCTQLRSSDPVVDDFPGLDISSLPSGAYKLQASVFDGANGLHDRKSLFFAVARPVPLPEFNVLLVPLVAFAVLAVLFFSSRRAKQ